MRVIAPRMWAIMGARLGKKNEMAIHRSPIPRAVSALQIKVYLKFW